MSRGLLVWLTVSGALGCGLIAGVFFAFSSFVMPALARLPASQGIAAMQSINIVVLNRWFLGVFVGTAALCLLLGVLGLMPASLAGGLRLAGSVLYLVGTFGVTRACNIPLNDALAKVNPDSAEGAELWQHYVREWSRWNHVRTAASLAAAGALTLSLL